MQTQNSYYWFNSALSPETCQKIIDMGKKSLQSIKDKGLSTEATTHGDNHKQAMKDALPQHDKTIEEMKKDLGEDKDVNKERYVRDSEVCWFNDDWLYNLIHPYLQTANIKSGWKYDWNFSESFQFTKYNKGGFYGWHADGSSDFRSVYKAAIKVKDKPIQFKPPKRDEKGFIVMRPDGKPEPDMRAADIPLKRDRKSLAPGYTDNIHMWDKVRKLSMTVNLTNPDNYAGGNLKFDLGPHAGKKRFKVCEEIRPQGSIIIFPSFLYHCVTPVTRGTRYSLVLWSLGRPWQ